MLPVLQEKIKTEIILEENMNDDTTYDSLLVSHPQKIKRIAQTYFLDYDHYSEIGHQVVADTLIHAISSPCVTK